jgi:hypothetical protein
VSSFASIPELRQEIVTNGFQDHCVMPKKLELGCDEQDQPSWWCKTVEQRQLYTIKTPHLA